MRPASPSPLQGRGWERGLRAFHQKFVYGTIAEIEGNKLEIDPSRRGGKG